MNHVMITQIINNRKTNSSLHRVDFYAIPEHDSAVLVCIKTGSTASY